MSDKNKNKLISTSNGGLHKGFYNDGGATSLGSVEYTEFFTIDDIICPYNEFPYDCADVFISGFCTHFAMALNELLTGCSLVRRKQRIIHVEMKWYCF